MQYDYYKELVEAEEDERIREQYKEWFYVEMYDLVVLLQLALHLEEEEHPVSIERRMPTDYDKNDIMSYYGNATYYLYPAGEGLRTPEERAAWKEAVTDPRIDRYTVGDGFVEDYKEALLAWIYQSVRNEFDRQRLELLDN